MNNTTKMYISEVGKLTRVDWQELFERCKSDSKSFEMIIIGIPKEGNVTTTLIKEQHSEPPRPGPSQPQPHDPKQPHEPKHEPKHEPGKGEPHKEDEAEGEPVAVP
jgi:hypothetical protein